MELQDYKSAHAKEMSAKAGLDSFVDFKVGDAVKMIGELPKRDRLRARRPLEGHVRALPGGLLSEAASRRDHRGRQHDARPGGDEVKAYAKAVRAKPKIDSVLVPVGSGLEISRFDAAE